MLRVSTLLRAATLLVLGGALLGVLAAGGVYWYLVPKLPAIDVLKDVQLQVPLRVYSRDERLVAEFGEKRRKPLRFPELPPTMVEAVLAAEDDRFYAHPGVDWQGLTRAVVHLLRTGEKGPGGSTITMQVARNFFLGREKTYVRKLNEILLALKIEQELSKDEILELYFNKIFLGHRAYGVGAAAQVYYGKPIDRLDLSQYAMIAGLPKAPSRFNPIVNPKRALSRRNYVLGRMRELGFITAEEHAGAAAAPVSARVHGQAVEVEAPYLAEMIRAEMESRVGDEAYTEGYSVYSSVEARLQEAANAALRKALIDYDARHGFRGPELALGPPITEEAALRALADIPAVAGVEPAVILSVDEQTALALTARHGEVELSWDGMAWAQPYIDENRVGKKPERAEQVLAPGDVVRVAPGEEGWELTQVPAVEGALVAIDPSDGAIVALTGGFDFFRSKFNRVTQAQRQPGSSFKPFIYSAAIERGFTPATQVLDAPVVFDDPGLETAWRPENYSGKFFGPTRLRVALYKSRNLVSIRILDKIGVNWAVEHASAFGFDVERLPTNLSLALGSGAVSPLELARAYAVLANGGYLVDPYFIDRVIDARGTVVERAHPRRVCPECVDDAPDAVNGEHGVEGEVAVAVASPLEGESGAAGDADEDAGIDESEAPAYAPRVLSADNAWLMASMMRDVVRRGTGRKARVLGRKDLAGKTGTTNDQRDAWFSGFNPRMVATAWVGFDKLDPLGRRETGGVAALPMWIDFMRVALEGMPEEPFDQPEGLITVRIDPESGKLAAAGDPDAIFETFRAGTAPGAERRGAIRVVRPADNPVTGAGGGAGGGSASVTEKLF